MTDLAPHETLTAVADGGEEWWRRAVVYQVYPRSFADSDGDGVGDIPGLIARLDHLEHLGVDAVWLSPVYASPGDDNGYDISDYRAIDPVFGTLDDFDALVASLHRRGMRLIMDLIVNHTSDEHPWFVDAASGAHSAHRDWYWWRPPRAGRVGGEPGAEPNNWGSFFSGSAWEYDPASGEYYLHLFSRKQPDLNWDNPAVRDAVYELMHWWIDRGVDGFRMDVINLISKDPALPDGVVPPQGRYGDGFPFYESGPRIHEFLHEMHERVFAPRGGGFVTVGEMPGVTMDEARLFTDPARRELDMVFQFDHVGLDHGEAGKWDHRPLDIRELKRSVLEWQSGLGRGWNSLYWNNHDQPRAVSRFGDDGTHRVESAKALAAVLHLQRGTPYVFQGEELGMTNAPFADIGEIRDIESLNHFAEATTLLATPPEAVLARIRRVGRDNARTPMQWDASENAGFTTGVPWIGVNPNHRDINVDQQRHDPGSVLEFYRALIAFRHREPVVVRGDFRMISVEHPRLFAFTRRDEEQELLVLANFSVAGLVVAAELVSESDWSADDLVLGSHDPVAAPARDALRPWETRVLLRTRTVCSGEPKA